MGHGQQPFPLGQGLEPVQSRAPCWEGWEGRGGKQPFPHAIWPSSGHHCSFSLATAAFRVSGFLVACDTGLDPPRAHPGGHPRHSSPASPALPGTHSLPCSSMKCLGTGPSSFWAWCFIPNSVGTWRTG